MKGTPEKYIPRGEGGWLAFESAVDPGAKAKDLAVTIERCQSAGVTWIAPRAGAGGGNDVSFNEESIQAYLSAGLLVLPWIFPYKATEARVIAGFKRWFLSGAHGVIINAEFEYQPATALEARALVAGIRDAWAEAQGERMSKGLPVIADAPFIAHAPPDYLGAGIGHALSDELVALDEECDAIMPQIYAWEHNDRGHVFHLERVMAGYAKRGLGPNKVWPVGCTYRPKQRCGKPTPLMLDEGKRVADDLVAFLEHPISMASGAASYYSLDAITWINRQDDHVMAALAMRHASKTSTTQPHEPLPSHPITPATPLGWQDRAEGDAKDDEKV